MSLKNFPERLKAARKMNGFSLQYLADKLDRKISKQALNKYEAGQSVPEVSMFSDLSKALNVPQDYFFRSNKIELDNLSFRKLSKLSVKEQDIVTHRTIDFLERHLELEDILGIGSHFVNPVKNWIVNSIADIESIAERLRSEWNLGEDPLYNVIELLEDLKIKVFEIEADPSFSGMSTWVDNKLPVIVLNSSKHIPVDRKRFTALHELGHLVLNIEQYSEKEQDRFCHAFAGAMLIPKSKMMDELGGHRQNIFMNELFALKRQYGMSIQAIMYRAKSLGLITESYFRFFAIRFNQFGYRKNEPVVYEGSEGSSRFRQLLKRL